VFRLNGGAFCWCATRHSKSIGLIAGKVKNEARGRFDNRSEDGTTFQSLLCETRESLAQNYLFNSSMSAGEISFLLGYEDPNSFHRAFRTWTGQTPDRARAAAV
jgi:methylphosphotriester-DNA--protein-cysteine methyltransferase